MSSKPENRLHIPSDMRYSCVQCGRSCSIFEEVTIEEASQQRLAQIAYEDLLPSDLQGGKPWKTSPVDDRFLILKKKADGACVFQANDKLCTIHRDHGFETKPQTCKDFPYRFVDTKEGAHVGLSFACTAVLRDEGQPLSEQSDFLSEQYPVANSRRSALREVRLTRRHEISWEAYSLIDDALVRISSYSEATVADRLQAMGVYLDLLVPMVRQLRGDSSKTRARQSPTEAGGTERFPADSGTEKDATIVAKVNEMFTGDAGMMHLFRLVKTRRGSKTFHRAFLGLMTGFRSNVYLPDKKPTRLGSTTSFLFCYLKALGKIGRIELEALGGKFDYSAFQQYGDEWLHDPEVIALLERYIRHAITRKDLLLSGSLWMGQRMMLIHYALLRWHTVGRARVEGLDAITIDTVREALRDVERYYVFHSDFALMFEKFPLLGMMLDGSARRPTFGASLVLSPV